MAPPGEAPSAGSDELKAVKGWPDGGPGVRGTGGEAEGDGEGRRKGFGDGSPSDPEWLPGTIRWAAAPRQAGGVRHQDRACEDVTGGAGWERPRGSRTCFAPLPARRLNPEARRLFWGEAREGEGAIHGGNAELNSSAPCPGQCAAGRDLPRRARVSSRGCASSFQCTPGRGDLWQSPRMATRDGPSRGSGCDGEGHTRSHGGLGRRHPVIAPSLPDVFAVVDWSSAEKRERGKGGQRGCGIFRRTWRGWASETSQKPPSTSRATGLASCGRHRRPSWSASPPLEFPWP
jgi:hypothetical protein